MHKIIMFIATFLIYTQIASAAMITGTIYDLYLERANDVIVEINTLPEQKIIAKEGRYSFNVPSGNYVITANRFVDGILEETASDNITVATEGEYSHDLIIFPYLGEDEYLMGDFVIPEIPDEETIEDVSREGLHPVLFISFILLAFLIIVSIILIPKLTRKPTSTSFISVTSDLQKLIDIIKSEGGRTTQKEIRKKMPLSEAKISLMISELEYKGIVKKIRKGRGNIIVLTGR